jgi:hypothetical protein
MRMCAMTVLPGQKGTAGVEEIPDLDMQDSALLVRGMAVGICGTDREIAEGTYGTPPSGEARLVIGHESLGAVLEAPAGSGFTPGDLVVGIVRRPDPMPCPACAAGEWDMCRTDSFGERGIVRLHGYASEHWRAEPDFAVPILPRLGELGVLLEPASVLAKAWDQVDQISRRAFFLRGRAMVTGAGPIGRRSACGRRSTLAGRPDHAPGAAHVLDRGARPVPGRHQGRRGPHRMTTWNASRRSRSTGISAPSRQPPGCYVLAAGRGSCSPTRLDRSMSWPSPRPTAPTCG